MNKEDPKQTQNTKPRQETARTKNPTAEHQKTNLRVFLRPVLSTKYVCFFFIVYDISKHILVCNYANEEVMPLPELVERPSAP